MRRFQDQDVSDSNGRELLSYATSRVEQACERYRTEEDWLLFGDEREGELVGIIGIQIVAPGHAIIQHIAVSMQARERGIGRRMIDQVRQVCSLQRLEAETDRDAVEFYRKYGFTIHSLGEKYPGVERFHCVFERTD